MADSAPTIDRNLRALLARRQEEERRKSFEERLADRITAFTGSMPFVYLHLLLFGGWIAANVGWLPVRPFDPDFVKLAMVASVEAIFLSTFVLISQNRMQADADQRAELDLHISLLAEHEVTRLIMLVRAMAERMGIEAAHDPALEELQRDVRPEAVLAKLDEYGPGA
jgi:uncharacterized membrane protein